MKLLGRKRPDLPNCSSMGRKQEAPMKLMGELLTNLTKKLLSGQRRNRKSYQKQILYRGNGS
jgi:hypothetical protein